MLYLLVGLFIIWELKSAFQHGPLHETISMTQLPGYIDQCCPNQLGPLHEVIYGLKLVPRVWFQRFNTFILPCDFIQNKADNSMFVYQCDTHYGGGVY